MKRFYSAHISDDIALLEGKEKAHCTKVLRTQIGEQVEIVDGKGKLFIGQLMAFDKHEATVQIVEQVNVQQQPNLISIACCIPKNASRWEWFLEKATEIGICEIIPLVAKRSEKKVIKRDRQEQIILSAAKQSGQLYFPVLKDVQTLSALLTSDTIASDKFIAHCEKNKKVFFGDAYQKGKEALILIGPEGDFTTDEISAALSNNFQPVSLGESRLRVETAAVVAAGIANWKNVLA